MSESGYTSTTTTWKCLRIGGYSTSERAAMTMVMARAESASEPCRSAVVSVLEICSTLWNLLRYNKDFRRRSEDNRASDGRL